MQASPTHPMRSEMREPLANILLKRGREKKWFTNERAKKKRPTLFSGRIDSCLFTILDVWRLGASRFFLHGPLKCI